MKNDGKVLEGEQLIPITESDNAAASMLKAGLQEHLTSDHWDIYENEISMLKPHGSGAFGTVYMVSTHGLYFKTSRRITVTSKRTIS
jgi:hypothetical protein